MKVIFLLNGLTHYFIPVLNQINRNDDIEVFVIVPKNKNTNVGNNVFLTQKGVEFSTYFLDEKKNLFGKTFFDNLLHAIKEIEPDIVVFSWPYVLELFFNLKLLKYLKKQRVKIGLKEIPFQVQSLNEAIRLKRTNFYDEELNYFNNSLFNRINNLFLALIRKYYYAQIDFYLHYTDEGYEMVKSYNVRKDKIFVTYNSPDTNNIFQAINIGDQNLISLDKNDFRLIHTGRLVKWKKVDLIIEAVSKLNSEFPQIELLVIGDGPELESLKNLAVNLKVEKHIKFLGAIYDLETLLKLYHSSAIYILGGMGGLSINEAMAFGKPIICSVCDGTEKKLVRDGYNGYYFNEDDVENLIDKIKLLLLSKNDIQKFGENSLSIIRNEININTVSDRYINAFRSILN